jgi:hypothetical protein
MSLRARRIQFGRYFGEKLVHNREELVVVPKGIEYALTSQVPELDHPDIRRSRPLSDSEWQELVSAIDWVSLEALPSQIGNPDANDAGGEFVEIESDRGVKRVDFPVDRDVPAIASLRYLLWRLVQSLSRSD